MFKIKKIEIWGFKDPNRRVLVEFSKEPISVIYGVNGSGKTTLLKIIHALLSHNESILLSEKVQNVILDYSYKRPNGRIVKSRAEVWLDENKKGASFNWQDSIRDEFGISSSILFGVNRGVTTSNIKIEPEMIQRYVLRNPLFRNAFENPNMVERFTEELTSYINDILRFRRKQYFVGRRLVRSYDHDNHLLLDNINIEQIENMLTERYRVAKRITSERVQKALFDTLSIAVNPKGRQNNHSSEVPEDFPELLDKNKERLVEALRASAENTLRNQIIEILDGFNDPYDYENRQLFKNELLSSLLYKMIVELQSEQLILYSINTLISVFNDQIAPWKRLVVTQEEAYIDLGNERRHSLSELSSGERHLLSFLTLFIVEGNNRDILMIDEPEISLNIKWQRQLLPLLSELAPESQIIVASHSPSIAKSNSNYLVELKVGE